MPARKKDIRYDSVYEPMLGSIAQAKRRPWRIMAALAICAAILSAAALSCSNASANSPHGGSADTEGDSAGSGDSSGQVTFVAVGDNIPDGVIGGYADFLKGERGDGKYDYAPIFENVKPLIESADLAYVNQETPVGGNEIGAKGYPSLNTTDEMARALADTGFDLVSSATEHAYDWGAYGANEHSREVWNGLPIAFTGTARNEEEAAQIAIVERKGIRFSLLNYTSYAQGSPDGEAPSYAISTIDEDRMRKDVALAREQSDVVMVAMHWGTENSTGIDDDQAYYAKFLADLGVDVILGTHPHVIGPIGWVDGRDGHKTLVAYSLGSFLSRPENPSALNELGGMLACTFSQGDYGIDITDVRMIPLVNHTEANYFSVYPLDEYTNELGAKHAVLSQLDDPVGWLRAASGEIVGSHYATYFYEPATNPKNTMHISREAKLDP